MLTKQDGKKSNSFKLHLFVLHSVFPVLLNLQELKNTGKKCVNVGIVITNKTVK